MLNGFQAAGSLARLSRHRYLLEIMLITYSLSPVSASTYSISLSIQDWTWKEALTVIFQAIVVSRVSYALLAWYGHLLQADIGRINALFRKAHRWQLTDPNFIIRLRRIGGRGRH